MSSHKILSISIVFVIVSIIAIIIIEMVISHRDIYHESAVVATLKNGIYLAELEQAKKATVDSNNNGKGEFILLSKLKTFIDESKNVNYCHPIIINNQGIGLWGNYYFTIYIPDGNGGALSDFISGRSNHLMEKGLLEQELSFIAYAWPMDGKCGRLTFCIDETGILRCDTWDGKIPYWNISLENGWKSKNVWRPFSK